ncbi:MAG TPA: FAD binding domain-containing protein [Advenella sp.]|nr:FAD binding domain-containing protein [Advenella sp.]
MKPRRFEFHNPQSIQGALRLAGEYEDDFIFYAGGTEAIIGMKERVIEAGHVLNLKKVPGLAHIEVQDGSLHIGALVTHQEIADSAIVQRVLPGYAHLSDNIANIRVRSAGTLAGNLCFAEPNADPPALLAALDARVVLLGAKGAREVSVREFFDGPYSTVREEDELMTQIIIPLGAGESRCAYRKVVYLNRPSAGVACVRNLVDGVPVWESWAGSITGLPERLNNVCAVLNERDMVDKTDVMEAAAQDMTGLDVLEGVYGSASYRKHLVAVLAVRSAMECVK